MAITPTREQFQAFSHASRGGEVVMLNLLHFSEPESQGAGERSGQVAYRDYSDQAVKMVEARGGLVLWMGRPEHVLIGDTDGDGWDLVVLVSYPNRAAFLDMVSSPQYQEAHTHRERGLDRTVLLACEPLMEELDSRV
jgi:uncharacterized protein (DUF1330 family)